jgi:broad specificity phosphatase PhoE
LKHPIRVSLRLALAAAVALPAASLAMEFNCNFPPEQLIVLRHAARQDDADDSPLSVKGWGQAVDLLAQLGDQEISSIFVTTKRRSQQTAIPLAEMTGIEPTVIADDEAGTMDMLRRVCRRQQSGTVVYVGHAYTLKTVYDAFDLESDGKFAAGAAHSVTFSEKEGAQVELMKQVRPARSRD